MKWCTLVLFALLSLESDIKSGVPQKYDQWNDSNLSFVQVDPLTRVPIVAHGDKFKKKLHASLREHSQALEALARRGIFAANAIKSKPLPYPPKDLFWSPLRRDKEPPPYAKIGLPIALIVGEKHFQGDLGSSTTPDLRFYYAGSAKPHPIQWPHYVEMELSNSDFPERGSEWAFDKTSKTLFLRTKELGQFTKSRRVTLQIDPDSGLTISEWFD